MQSPTPTIQYPRSVFAFPKNGRKGSHFSTYSSSVAVKWALLLLLVFIIIFGLNAGYAIHNSEE